MKKENDLQKDQPDVHDRPTGKSGTDSFTIVGIGASAGALKACQGFFTNLPPDSGAAFVIVIHLDPSHSSIFVELLQKYTQMPVFEAVNGMTVEPNCVYVIPPNAEITIQHGKLQLHEQSKPRVVHLAIDLFFRSLAEDRGESAVCIILSGTGTDGTLGLRAVKAGLGMVIVQDPATAEYDGMPRSAADTGLADYILPVEEIPAQLLAYMNGFCQRKSGAPAVRESGRDSLGEVLDLLRGRTGHDFSLYKKGTIGRRIERRMNVNHIARITEYVRFLEDNPGEAQILFRELLINVTSFFRDPEAFAFLKEQALPQLLAGKPEDYTLRVWAPGCATGEEVYSLAIVLRECLDALRREFKVQIFGTDMDDEAITTARRGVYPLNISADISPERLNSFFITENETYKIRKDIRDVAIFAVHDVLKDPPFAKLDLICCRNLLIYIKAPLQKRLLSLFHHLLQPGGILLLGSAESLGEMNDYFTIVNQKWRIFQRRESPELPPMAGFYPVLPANQRVGPIASSIRVPDDDHLNISQMLVQELIELVPPSVVINGKAEIIFVHGRTGKYLEPASGQPSWNIFDMAREGLKYELKIAIQQANAERTPVVRERILVVSDSSAEFVKLTVRPITGSRSLEGLLLVMFEVQGQLESQTQDAQPEQASTPEHASMLEQELSQTRQLLQATVKDMEASYQEVASANEELLSTNEELQSSNEELETSKEEMQSLYEELITVNSELQIKLDELARSNSDLNNFLNSTEIAAIFLDNELKIRRFTPLATQMFKLLPVDVGRPLEHIVSNLAEVNLIEDARGVLDNLVLFNKEVRTKQGVWHMMRILPYRNEKYVIDGAVITFTDINEQKSALAQVEQKIAEATEFNQKLLQSSPLGIITYGSSGQAVYANDASADIFGATKEQILQLNLNDFESWKQAGILDIAKQVLETGVTEQMQGYFQSVFGKDVWLKLRFSRFTSGNEPHLLVMYEDITDHKLAEEYIIKLNSDLTKRAHELTKINKELESFSYSISHDLRAPLRAMNGFSKMIFDKYYDRLDETGREYLQIIRSECNRMADLINGILNLSRLSRKELKCEELDLSVMAETITAELKRSAPERQVEFAITPGIMAYGDKVLLQSVLQNLLENAWKFTGKHDQARIEFGVTEQEGKKAYFVRDDGAGFDMKFVDKLFGTFQRIHGADEFPGNGVGLAIVQRIIHHHGGQVWAEGEVEKGATFYFTLG
ncbi:MAG: chemotaxis protein CheB [Thermacetogeniaceae bacterium]